MFNIKGNNFEDNLRDKKTQRDLRVGNKNLGGGGWIIVMVVGLSKSNKRD